MPALIEINAQGLRCPLPVLKLEKALDGAHSGQTLILTATDPVARVDIPLVCRKKGLACTLDDAGGILRFTIMV